jgi:lysosomal acid lipase/cholesteryl ester hydrolase
MLPLILTHTPAGTSLKTVIHYAQGIQSKKFRQYDYGFKMNTKFYNSSSPPEYNLSKIDVPIELFWGKNDFLSQRKVYICYSFKKLIY